MATENDFRRSALALEGTIEAPHFDRTAFKAARIYATLAALTQPELALALETAWRHASKKRRKPAHAPCPLQ